MTQPEDESVLGEEFAPGDHLDPEERDPEASAEDAVEQSAAADPTDAGPASATDAGQLPRGLEVDEWDALEQARIIGPEDDYR
ncbi:hypothetical protein BDK92_3438 [Micromonospora pisi]|uniref:Uncharacterized protein n=1 Tax=Micromonospora pisi TaxID=589240 RepID=A0A495JJW2_9ACTN|nr:hypothetical protein [Micromonospora pisi]RKR89101.1 hypothetical protein BDK92_3438 [Micromonospora pisi]